MRRNLLVPLLACAGLILLLPVTIVLAAAFYVVAIVEAVRSLFRRSTVTSVAPEDLPGPHRFPESATDAEEAESGRAAPPWE